MSDLKRKLAEKIARDLFTSNERTYSHLSLNDAAELGWCEKAVADRIEEHLMDEYEEPKPVGKDHNRCAVCGWPLMKSVEYGCIRGNCSQRPLPTGEWYDPDRAVREGYPFESAKPHGAHEQEPKPAPTWEPGMLVEHFDASGKRIQFEIEAVGGRYLHDRHGSSYFIGNCRHVPAPRKENDTKYHHRGQICNTIPLPRKEQDAYQRAPEALINLAQRQPKEDPLTGPHWDETSFEISAVARCICDLRDEVRRLKEEK